MHHINFKAYLFLLSVLLVQTVYMGVADNQDIHDNGFQETENVDYIGSTSSAELPGDVISAVLNSVSNFTFSSLNKVDYSGPFSFFYHRNQILITRLISGFFEGSVSIHQLILNHLYPFFFFF